MPILADRRRSMQLGKLSLTVAAAATLAAGGHLEAQSASGAIVAAGQAVFDAMAARDTARLRTLLHPIAHFVATVESGDSVVVRGTTREEFFSAIARMADVPRERMTNPEVRVSGAIATIWTPYDFHVGSAFSHCGVDSFQLVRTSGGWQVTSIIYTIVRPEAQCQANPPR
jgi:Putative lumazine-binding